MQATERFNRKRKTGIFRFFLLGLMLLISHQYAASQDFFPEFHYYTTEDSVSLIYLNDLADCPLYTLSINNKSCLTKHGQDAEKSIFKAEKELFETGRNTVKLYCSGSENPVDSCTVLFLPGQSNEIKLNRLNGLLYHNHKPLFISGFYSYWPVDLHQLAEERANGFNLISPYIDLFQTTRKERKAFMDACAALGLKVNYNLLSITQVGGLGYRKEKRSESELLKALRKEVEAFRKHPALLAWYIADEPAAQGADPEFLTQIYTEIKRRDPYHPVSMVFMQPGEARTYAQAFDIVMADPYVIPNGDLSAYAATCRNLAEEFRFTKGVWMVPQAFGGAEWWPREPDKFEIRAMAYLSVINEAGGLQYFIRKGPNAFPKSKITWNEAAAVATETNRFIPFLATTEPKPDATSSHPDLQFNLWKKEKEILLIVQNTSSATITAQLKVEGINFAGPADVLFENRTVQNSAGQIVDQFPPFASHVYVLKTDYELPVDYTDNLFINPGFEKNRMPGVPEGCYVKMKQGQNSFYSLSSVDYTEGSQSLELFNSKGNESLRLEFYPFLAQSGQSYILSISAKASKDNALVQALNRSFVQRFFGQSPVKNSFGFGLKQELINTFTPGINWEQFTTYYTNSQSVAKRINPVLELNSAGTIYFDAPGIYADPVLNSKVRNEALEISISSRIPGAEIRFTRDGSTPKSDSEKYLGEFSINNFQQIHAGVFVDQQLVLSGSRSFHPSLSTGKTVVYQNIYQTNYSAGGSFGLVNGITGSTNYRDGNWQGFIGQDFDATVNLNYQMQISRISVNFLTDFNAWIFQPEQVEFYISKNGIDFEKVYSEETRLSKVDPANSIKTYSVDIPGRSARYVRVLAKNTGTCPDWHKGSGQAAWLFVDEIIIE